MLQYRAQRWADCYANAMRALQITDRNLVYTCDPAVWGFQPHDLAAISAWNMGLKEIAQEQGRIASEMEPDDTRLSINLAHYLGLVPKMEDMAA